MALGGLIGATTHNMGSVFGQPTRQRGGFGPVPYNQTMAAVHGYSPGHAYNQGYNPSPGFGPVYNQGGNLGFGHPLAGGFGPAPRQSQSPRQPQATYTMYNGGLLGSLLGGYSGGSDDNLISIMPIPGLTNAPGSRIGYGPQTPLRDQVVRPQQQYTPQITTGLLSGTRFPGTELNQLPTALGDMGISEFRQVMNTPQYHGLTMNDWWKARRRTIGPRDLNRETGVA